MNEASLHISTQSAITDELLLGLHECEIVTLRLSGTALQNTEKSHRLWDALQEMTSFLYVHLLDGVVPAERVARLLHNCPEMSILEIGRAQIEGNPAALEEFECCLAEHKRLQEFHCMDADVTWQGVSLNTNIDNVIKSLSLIPTLSVLKIQASEKHNLYCSKFCLAPILYCKSLTHLHLGRLPMEEGHFSILALGVAISKSLKTLALPHTNMTDKSVKSISASCGVPTCALSTIDFACNRISDDGCNALAKNLAHSKQMRVVKLDGNKEITNKGFSALAMMLEVNTNIHALEISSAGKESRVIIDEQLSKNRAEQSATSAMAA